MSWKLWSLQWAGDSLLVSGQQTPILTHVEARTVRKNGWTFAVVTYPKWVAAVLGALMAACIERSGGLYLKRRCNNPISRSHRSIVSDAFTGMATELALCFWLKNLGLNAKMVFPRVGPDQGFDVVIHTPGGDITFDAKGSMFRDGRWIERLRLGDKLRASDRTRQPDLYAWGIVDPVSIQPTAQHVTVGLVAVLPKYALHPGRSGLELSFGALKNIIPQPTPEVFAHAQLQKYPHDPAVIQIPDPPSRKPASMIRTLTDELDLLSRPRQRYIANVLLDMELIWRTGKLLAGEPTFQWPHE